MNYLPNKIYIFSPLIQRLVSLFVTSESISDNGNPAMHASNICSVIDTLR